MIAIILILCCCAFASVHHWNATTDGFWSDTSNWDTADIPSQYSSVILSPQTFPITVIVESEVLVSSLTLSSNVELLFTHNSNLTVSDSLTINGGSLSTHLSSSLSFSSVESLVMASSELVTLSYHKLIVTGLFDWKLSLFLSILLLSFLDSDFSQGPNDLYVWGLNSNGQLGGDLQTSSVGISPESYTLPVSIRQASLGKFHSLILSTSGDVYTAGSNIYGQLGYNGEGRTVHDKIELSNIIQVLSSHNSSFALTASGHVFSWGGNFNGELGLGDVIDRNTPTLIGNLNNIKQIAGRYSTTFTLSRNGQVFGWGSSDFNILCSHNTINIISPMLIDGLENVKFIAAGSAAFFIKEDGSTLTCGRFLSTTTSQPSFTLFAEDIEFTFIDTLVGHALGIDVNQKLWSWGWNSDGRLGDGGSTNSPTPVTVVTIGKVIAAAAGWDHSVAVDVNNDVWFWGTESIQFRFFSPQPISPLLGKGITHIHAYFRCNVALAPVPPRVNFITSSSQSGVMTLEENNQNIGSINDESIQQYNLISIPVFLSGSLNLTSDSFFFLSEFNLNAIMSINSPVENLFTLLFLGASECSTLSLESNVFVETLYWYCGTIEGVGELKVNTLVFCSSNPELKLSRISIGKIMMSELNVELKLTNDLIFSVNGIIEIAQLSFYSDLDVNLTLSGNIKLVNTSLNLCVDSHINSKIQLDQSSKIQIISSSSTLGFDLSLFLYYDWSESSSGNDLSGNNNNVLEVSGAQWNSDGYYQFKTSTDVIKIPNIPGKIGWESATVAFSIWFDTDTTIRFGFGTNHSGCGLVIGDHLSFGDVTIEDLSIPRNQWISLIVTTDHSGAQMYINGALSASVNGKYDCDEFADFFPLGSVYYKSGNDWVPSSDQFFKGRIRRVVVFTQKLADIEVKSLSETQLGSLTQLIGDGNLVIQNSSLLVNSLSTMGLNSLYSFNSSLFIVYLE
ncbi:hypothetical protein GEMRC1_008182 [Eukaryota sp. GEM-RC1]